MPIKIWYQSTLDLDRYPRYRSVVESRSAEVLADSDTVVHVHSAPVNAWGDKSTSGTGRSPYSTLTVLARFLIGQAEQAQDESYDAFVIGSYTEPFLREVRSAVAIPVVSMLESAVLMACSTARRIGVITLNDWYVHRLRTALERHRLHDRIAAYLVADELDEPAVHDLFEDPTAYLATFQATARIAIDRYADVIVPAEELVAALVASAGLTEVDGVSVLDGIGVPLIHAQMLGRMHRRLSLQAGRHWHYTRPDPRYIALRAGTRT